MKFVAPEEVTKARPRPEGDRMGHRITPRTSFARASTRATYRHKRRLCLAICIGLFLHLTVGAHYFDVWAETINPVFVPVWWFVLGITLLAIIFHWPGDDPDSAGRVTEHPPAPWPSLDAHQPPDRVANLTNPPRED